MSVFPLYDHLSSEKHPDVSLAAKEREELLKGLKKLDHNGTELVYALIFVHSMKTNGTSKTKVPYDGEYIEDKKTAQFVLTELPSVLQRILLSFVRLHNKTTTTTT